MSENEESDLDPRIQVELEKLNTTTDEINRLELEYDEANTTFRMLLNESTRRLKILSKKLGSSIDRARPYYEALDVAKQAQKECQKAAVEYQRAHEIHAAAKETVALAEQRFMSNQHEWQFDNAWQEMLNHATIKVMEAENTKSENGREHQRRASIFNAAEEKLKQFEKDKFQKSIIKSRPYFDEKTLCQEQLNTQKERIETIKRDIIKTKALYAQTLKSLEQISNEIHLKRGHSIDFIGPREPGVGAELESCHDKSREKCLPSLDYHKELDKCELRSVGSVSGTNSSAVSERDEDETETVLDEELEGLKEFKRPANGGEGESKEVWQSELENSAEKMDHLALMMQGCAAETPKSFKSEVSIFVGGATDKVSQ